MAWINKLAVLGLAAAGGMMALRLAPVETRHRMTRAVGDWVNRKMLDHMSRVMASLPEGAPPKLVMSVLPKLEAQHEEILALLRRQNELLQQQQKIGAPGVDA